MNCKHISRRTFISTSILSVITSTLPAPLIAAWKEKENTITASNQMLINNIFFNGVANDSEINSQHLGNGYRIYNPSLMRFHVQDSLSPFSKGGVNAYGYVSGDPLNYVDPSGHMKKSTIFTPKPPKPPKPQNSRPQPRCVIPAMTKLQTQNSKWKVYSGADGEIEIAAIGTVFKSDVIMASDALGRKPSIRKRSINIYSGMHGARNGKNWGEDGDAKYRDASFIVGDVFDLYLENDGRNDVVALPKPWTGLDGYIAKMKEPHTHGIHAYCYSDRDENFQRAMLVTGMKHIGFL